MIFATGIIVVLLVAFLSSAVWFSGSTNAAWCFSWDAFRKSRGRAWC